MRSPKYAPGDVFRGPLRSGGYAVGVIARVGPDGIICGFFYSPQVGDTPNVTVAVTGEPTAPLLVARVVDRGLATGAWPVVARVRAWDTDVWRMPTFHRFEQLTGRFIAVEYADHDPNRLVRERVIAANDALQLPEDDLYGAGALELELGALLREKSAEFHGD